MKYLKPVQCHNILRNVYIYIYIKQNKMTLKCKHIITIKLLHLMVPITMSQLSRIF